MDQGDDGLPALGRDDVLVYSHQMPGLGSGFVGLGHMDVHLVAVEISVEGRADTLVESE